MKTFYIKALWDEEAGVFVSESDIKGFHIEAKSLDEFEALIQQYAADLAVRNHILNQPGDITERSIRELVPGILWQRPDGADTACV